MKQAITFLYLFFCCRIFFAQPFVKNDLKKINAAYRTAEHLSMNISARLYKNKADKTGSLIGNGYMKKSGTNYYSSFGTDEFLQNKKTVLIIDNKNKSITICEHGSTKIKNASQMPDIDSVLSQADSVVYKGEDATSKHYIFYTAASAIKRIDLYATKKDFFIKQLVYYYKDDTEEESLDMYKVAVDYTNMKLDKIDEHVFSEQKYILIDQGKVKLSTGYQKYILKSSENE